LKIAIKCGIVHAHFDLGLCEFNLSNYSQAKEHFLKAIDLNCVDEKDDKLFYYLGFCENIQGNYPKAIEYLTHSANLDNYDACELLLTYYSDIEPNSTQQDKYYIKLIQLIRATNKDMTSMRKAIEIMKKFESKYTDNLIEFHNLLNSIENKNYLISDKIDELEKNYSIAHSIHKSKRVRTNPSQPKSSQPKSSRTKSSRTESSQIESNQIESIQV
jgi:tetratricopeptide (TPR) repeat protein